MASESDTTDLSKPDPSFQRSHGEDDFMQLHTATATTDYNAFLGKEEYISSDDSAEFSSKPKSASRAKAKKSRKAQRAVDSSSNSKGRLRPALDVLSRLRHDPGYSSQSFTIGYLDRHSPEVMELPLTAWKGGDVTDEEFIPQHRILWFKRDADGKKMWDRNARLDEIFGSGSGPSSAGLKEGGTVASASASPEPRPSLEARPS